MGQAVVSMNRDDGTMSHRFLCQPANPFPISIHLPSATNRWGPSPSIILEIALLPLFLLNGQADQRRPRNKRRLCSGCPLQPLVERPVEVVVRPRCHSSFRPSCASLASVPKATPMRLSTPFSDSWSRRRIRLMGGFKIGTVSFEAMKSDARRM